MNKKQDQPPKEKGKAKNNPFDVFAFEVEQDGDIIIEEDYIECFMEDDLYEPCPFEIVSEFDYDGV